MTIANIQIITAISLIAAGLTILEYFKYLPDAMTIIRNPKSILNVHKKVLHAYYFKRFWKPFVKENNVIMILPPGDVDDRRDTQVLDHQGANELLRDLNNHFRSLEIDFIPSDSFNETAYKDYNIISVSGPIPNSVTRDILYNNSSQHIPYKFGKMSTGKIINSILLDNGSLLSPVTSYDEEREVETIEHDYGIITRAKSPYNSRRAVINVSGGFGEGTLGGFRILRDPEKLDYLYNEGGKYFQALYGVPIGENDQVLEPTFVSQFDADIKNPIVQLGEPDQNQKYDQYE